MRHTYYYSTIQESVTDRKLSSAMGMLVLLVSNLVSSEYYWVLQVPMELSLRSPFFNAKNLRDGCSGLANKLIACTSNSCSVFSVKNLHPFLSHNISRTHGMDWIDRIFAICFARAFD